MKADVTACSHHGGRSSKPQAVGCMSQACKRIAVQAPRQQCESKSGKQDQASNCVLWTDVQLCNKHKHFASEAEPRVGSPFGRVGKQVGSSGTNRSVPSLVS